MAVDDEGDPLSLRLPVGHGQLWFPLSQGVFAGGAFVVGESAWGGRLVLGGFHCLGRLGHGLTHLSNVILHYSYLFLHIGSSSVTILRGGIVIRIPAVVGSVGAEGTRWG